MIIRDNRANRRRWVGAFAAVVACLTMADRHGRGDDAKGGPKPGAVITNSIGMKLAYIPAGEFLMGSPDSDDQAFGCEKPQHRVRITRPFHLGVHEVTQRKWKVVMATTPWKGKDDVKEGDRYPAMYVSWNGAMEFCRKLTEKERGAGRLKAGESYRLPTEAEWEYACRAGSGTRYHCGDGAGSLGEYEWYRNNAHDIDEKYAHAVGLKRANAWGLFDMHGNVSEWCSDWYGEKYYGQSPEADPQGPMEDGYRVFRGGCWYCKAWICRAANRDGSPPEDAIEFVGFRVVRTIAPSE